MLETPAFAKNLEPFRMAKTLINSVGDEGAADLLGLQLMKSLEEVPYYDPEGWSLMSIAEPSPCCTRADSAR